MSLHQTVKRFRVISLMLYTTFLFVPWVVDLFYIKNDQLYPVEVLQNLSFAVVFEGRLLWECGYLVTIVGLIVVGYQIRILSRSVIEICVWTLVHLIFWVLAFTTWQEMPYVMTPISPPGIEAMRSAWGWTWVLWGAGVGIVVGLAILACWLIVMGLREAPKHT